MNLESRPKGFFLIASIFLAAIFYAFAFCQTKLSKICFTLFLFIFAFLFVPRTTSFAALTETLNNTMWSVDDASGSPIIDMVHDGTNTYVAGDFYYVGPITGHGVPISLSTGLVDNTYPRIDDNEVYYAISDNADGWYIGGYFTKIDGITRTYVARIKADGTLDPTFNVTLDRAVHGLLLSDDGNTLYLGGLFTTVNGTSRTYMAAVNSSTGALVSGFNANITSAYSSPYVKRMLYNPGHTEIIIGGYFTSVGGSSRYSIASVNPTTGAVGSWYPAGAPDGIRASSFAGYVREMVSDGTYIYVAGYMTAVSGTSRTNFVRLDATTAAVDSMTISLLGSMPYIASMIVTPSYLYVGGPLTGVNGVSRQGLAQIDLASNTTTSFNASIWAMGSTKAEVNAMTLIGSDLYIGGLFRTIGGTSRHHLAVVDATTGALGSWDPKAGSRVNVLTKNDSSNKVYVASVFPSFNGLVRRGIAKINGDGTADPNFDAQLDGRVANAEIYGDDLLIGGSFTSAGGSNHDYLAKIDKATGAVDDTWSPDADGIIRDMALVGNNLFVGGDFSTIAGGNRMGVAKISACDGSLDDWDASISDGDYVEFLEAMPNGEKVYLAGYFTSIGGLARDNFGAAYQSAQPVEACIISDTYLDESFEDTNLPTGWTTGGNAVWDEDLTSASDGSKSISSGAIANSQIVYVEKSITFTSDGSLTFDWKVDSEQGYDYLVFCIDNSSCTRTSGYTARISGAIDWASQSYDVSAGAHTFTWKYAKDSSSADGADKGWIDNIQAVTYSNAGTCGGSPYVVDWAPAVNDTFLSMKISPDSSTLYIGGYFDTVDGQARNELAAYDTSTDTVTSWNPNPNSHVMGIDVSADSNTVFLAGFFTNIAATARHSLAAIDASGSILSWDPIGAGTGLGVLYFVDEQDDTVFISSREIWDFQGEPYKMVTLFGDYPNVTNASPPACLMTEPEVQFTATSGSGSESTTSVNIELSLSSGYASNVTVDYAVTGGTATVTDDFTIAGSTATITAGNTTTNIPLTIVDDSSDESDETVEITISSPSNATLGTNTVFTYTITDNDEPAGDGGGDGDNDEDDNNAPNKPKSFGPKQNVTGKPISDNQPKITFKLSDPDGDEVGYKIQISKDKDFRKIEVEYSSDTQNDSTQSFTVGQDKNGGDYDKGKDGQKLDDGEYYVRVRAKDEHGLSSDYAKVNKGEVAFIVDTTPPVITNVIATIDSKFDDRFNITWQTNEVTKTEFKFGESDFDLIEIDDSLKKEHWQVASNLSLGRFYSFIITAIDEVGNQSKYEGTFTVPDPLITIPEGEIPTLIGIDDPVENPAPSPTPKDGGIGGPPSDTTPTLITPTKTPGKYTLEAPGMPESTSLINNPKPEWTWKPSNSEGIENIIYELFWSTDKKFRSNVFMANTETNSYTPTMPISDGVYYFMVRAKSGDLYSRYSKRTRRLIHTKAPVISNLTTSYERGLLRINWETDENSTSNTSWIIEDAQINGMKSVPKYRKQHRLVIANPGIGNKYVFTLSETDNYGNNTTQSFTLLIQSPLPEPEIIPPEIPVVEPPIIEEPDAPVSIEPVVEAPVDGIIVDVPIEEEEPMVDEPVVPLPDEDYFKEIEDIRTVDSNFDTSEVRDLIESLETLTKFSQDRASDFYTEYTKIKTLRAVENTLGFSADSVDKYGNPAGPLAPISTIPAAEPVENAMRTVTFMSVVAWLWGIISKGRFAEFMLVGLKVVHSMSPIEASGTVFDIKTKKPIKNAYVLLKDQRGKVIRRISTGKDGAYGFLVKEGFYHIEVHKSGYRNLTAEEHKDPVYGELYHGEQLKLETVGLLKKNIGLVPDKSFEGLPKSGMLKIQILHLGKKVMDTLGVVGIAFSVIMLILTFSYFDFALFITGTLFSTLRIILLSFNIHLLH